MVTIEVGAEKEHFVVHASYLCAKSQFFKTAVESLHDDRPDCIYLPNVPTILFRIFLVWLYHGFLCDLPPLRRTVTADLDSLEITEENLEHSFILQHEVQDNANTSKEGSDSDDSDDDNVNKTPVVVTEPENDTVSALESVEDAAEADADSFESLGDDPSTWSYHSVIQLYVLADCFQIRELKANTLDALSHAAREQNWAWSLIEIRYIYSKTPADSPLKNFVVHNTAYRRIFDQDISYFAAFPAEFLAAVMITNSRRLPFKQCEDCYRTAFEDQPVPAPQTDHRNLSKTLHRTRQTCASTTNTPTKKTVRLAAFVAKVQSLLLETWSWYTQESRSYALGSDFGWMGEGRRM